MGGRKIVQEPITETEALKQLRLLSLGLFVISELAMTAIVLAYLAAHQISVSIFLANFLSFSAFIIAIIAIAHQYSKRAWVRIFFMQKEITKRAENESALLDATGDAALLLDSEGEILAINQKGADILGGSRDELESMQISEVLPGEVIENGKKKIEGLERDKSTIEFRTDYKDRTYDVRAVPITDNSGKLERLAVFARDITRDLALQRKLHEVEDRYRELFESSLDGIIATDSDGKIVQCNRAFEEMLGYDRGELLFKSTWEITPAEWHTVDRDAIENQLLVSGRTDEYTKELIRKDGTRCPVSIRAWTTGSGDSSAVAWGIVRDMSLRRLYEQFIRETIIKLEEANMRLKEADRLKDEFVAVVSHELRSPLETIKSSIQALKATSESSLSSEAREMIGVAERGIKKLSRIVGDLLDLSRIESGQLRLRYSLFNAGELTGKIYSLYEPRFRERGLEFTLEKPEEPLWQTADPGRIEQVLSNLLENALKFTEKGKVTLSVSGTPQTILYSVSDTGRGIPIEYHNKIFEKFSSVEEPVEGEQEGIGLGLAICRGIVEAHGGKIRLESAKGSGSTFYCEIPRDSRKTKDRANNG